MTPLVMMFSFAIINLLFATIFVDISLNYYSILIIIRFFKRVAIGIHIALNLKGF